MTTSRLTMHVADSFIQWLDHANDDLHPIGKEVTVEIIKTRVLWKEFQANNSSEGREDSNRWKKASHLLRGWVWLGGLCLPLFSLTLAVPPWVRLTSLSESDEVRSFFLVDSSFWVIVYNVNNVIWSDSQTLSKVGFIFGLENQPPRIMETGWRWKILMTDQNLEPSGQLSFLFYHNESCRWIQEWLWLLLWLHNLWLDMATDVIVMLPCPACSANFHRHSSSYFVATLDYVSSKNRPLNPLQTIPDLLKISSHISVYHVSP